jgi:hypothetical protein
MNENMTGLWLRQMEHVHGHLCMFGLYHGDNKLHFNQMTMTCLFPEHHAMFDFYSANSLNQQSINIHIAPLVHIILILSQQVSALTSYYYVLSRETVATNFIVFGLARPGLKSTIYRKR